MRITCPHCYSEQVIRVIQNTDSQGINQSIASSVSFATVGTALSKALPVSPLVGGLAGAVVGGLLSSVFSPSAPAVPHSYFQCQSCGLGFH